MADSTVLVALIAGGSAALAAGAGGLAPMLGEKWRVRAEERRHLRERHEAERERRKEIYQEFLAVLFRFHQDASGIQRFDIELAQRSFVDLENCLNAMRLFGSAEAGRQAKAVADILEEYFGLIQPDDQLGHGLATPSKAYLKIEPKLLKAWDELIEIMRKDVGPGS